MEWVFLGKIPPILSHVYIVKLGRIASLDLNFLGHFESGVDPMAFESAEGAIEAALIDLVAGVGDSEHLPWNDESFDTITCIASFHHYPNPESVLREMIRVLKHGGSLKIADPWAPSPWRSLANLIGRTRLNRSGDIKMYSQKEMHELFEGCGLWIRIDEMES